MAVICPFENKSCCACEHAFYNADKQMRACYYGQPQEVIDQARQDTMEHDKRVREYHMEEARIGDL